MQQPIELSPLAEQIIAQLGHEAAWRHLAEAALTAANNPRRKRNRYGHLTSIRFFEGLDGKFGEGSRAILTFQYDRNRIIGQIEHAHWRLRDDEIALADLPDAILLSLRNGAKRAEDILPFPFLQGQIVASVERRKTLRWKIRVRLRASPHSEPKQGGQ